MKFLLLIQQGDAPLPQTEEWAKLSEEEQNAVYSDYQAINETPGVTTGLWLQPPQAATTVRVKTGETLTTERPLVPVEDAVNGYLVFEGDSLDDAVELASRIPQARMGGAVEVRPIVEP
jgi:hypothetical protein